MRLLPDEQLSTYEVAAYEGYFHDEGHFMAAEGFLTIANVEEHRGRAIKKIVQLSNPKPEEFQACIPYLALIYFDRFMSRRKELLRDCLIDKYATCCMTLASRMKSQSFNTEFFLYQYGIEPNMAMKDIFETECEILNTLDWRLWDLTALSFLKYFVRGFRGTKGFELQIINEIVIQAHADITITKFKPSTIAASALLAASSSLYPVQYNEFFSIVLGLRDGVTEEISDCLTVIKKVCQEKNILVEDGGRGMGEASQLHEPKEMNSEKDLDMKFKLKW